MCFLVCKGLSNNEVGGWQGAPYFRRYGRELVSKQAISLRIRWGGYRRMTLHHVVRNGCTRDKVFLGHTQYRRENMFNSSGASMHLGVRPCSSSNLSEHSPSSNHTHACMLSWNWRMTASILGGTPNQARTSHRRVRSTGAFALVRSIKHNYKGVSFRASSCSRRTTNIMSTIERSGLNPHCSSGKMFSHSQYSLRRPAMTLRTTLSA